MAPSIAPIMCRISKGCLIAIKVLGAIMRRKAAVNRVGPAMQTLLRLTIPSGGALHCFRGMVDVRAIKNFLHGRNKRAEWSED